MSKKARVVVTGAAGQISYALLFRIASGQFLGPDYQIELSLLEIDVEAAVNALKGVTMELDDCAFPQLASYERHTDANKCFAGADYAFLVGARPRSKGMERKDLLEANAQIFSVQGKAIAAAANKDIKVIVVGNPANTNCLITQRNAKGIDPANFTAMTRLDHNRMVSQLANKAQTAVSEIKNVTIWGNHSATQFPDLAHASVTGKPALEVVERSWYENEMIPAVQKRGAAIIDARGASSAASAANAAIDHMREWALDTPGDGHTSMAVVSAGQYGVEAGLIYSYPCTCKDGKWKIVEGLTHDEFAKQKMQVTEQELAQERDAVASLLG